MTPTDSVSTHYQDEAGQRYVKHYQSDPDYEGYKVDLKFFKPMLKPTDTILDFGCGNGGLLRLLSDHVERAEALEVNPHAAEIARSQGLTVYSSIEEIPTGPVYDVILSNHVLEHVRDPISTLERLRKSMKPGGKLLLKLPIDDWRARDQRRWRPNDINHHFQTWTPLLIGNVLTEAGFKVERTKVITSAWHPRLFPLIKYGLERIPFWLISVITKRRELFAEATFEAEG